MPTKVPRGNLDQTSFKSACDRPASSSPPGGGSIACPRRGLAAVQVIRADAHGRHDEQEDHDLDDDMPRLSQRTANHIRTHPKGTPPRYPAESGGRHGVACPSCIGRRRTISRDTSRYHVGCAPAAGTRSTRGVVRGSQARLAALALAGLLGLRVEVQRKVVHLAVPFAAAPHTSHAARSPTRHDSPPRGALCCGAAHADRTQRAARWRIDRMLPHAPVLSRATQARSSVIY